MCEICKFKVSPNYCKCHLTTPRREEEELEAMIDVFEDRVKGWFLNWASFLQEKGGEHVGFAVLMILFSYFEEYIQYKTGLDSSGRSETTFGEGFLAVFPELNGLEASDLAYLLKIAYKSARCGFFHAGMTKNDFFIMDNNGTLDAIIFEDNKMYVDRYKFLKRVQDHFDHYLVDLRDEKNVLDRSNFEKFWKHVNKGKIY